MRVERKMPSGSGKTEAVHESSPMVIAYSREETRADRDRENLIEAFKELIVKYLDIKTAAQYGKVSTERALTANSILTEAFAKADMSTRKKTRQSFAEMSRLKSMLQ